MKDVIGMRKKMPASVKFAGKEYPAEHIGDDIRRYIIGGFCPPQFNGFIAADALTGRIVGVVGVKDIYRGKMNDPSEISREFKTCIKMMVEEYKKQGVEI